MSAIRFWLALPLCVLLLSAGCGGGGDDDSSGSTTTTSTAATSTAASTTAVTTASSAQTSAVTTATGASTSVASTTTAAAPTLLMRESPDVPRSVYYSDMTYTVTDAVVTNATLRTYDGPEPVVGEDMHLVVHLTVKNELNGRVQHFNLNFFKLEAGGTSVDAVQVPGQPVFTAQAASSVDVLIAFEVTEAFDFDDAILVIAEPGTETAPLALTGPVRESGYPFEIEITGGDEQVTSGNPCGTTMVVTTLAVEVDLDARVDGAGSASAIDGSRRAAEGERFIRIDMRATGDSNQCGGANVQDAVFRLQIDGVPRGAMNNVNDIVRPGEAIDFTLLYRAPVDATELVLLAGAPSGTVAGFPLTFESLSP